MLGAATGVNLNGHPFARGESIYFKPDMTRVLSNRLISGSKAAMAEFAALVVEYEALEKRENKGFLDPYKRRELGLKKVALYNKYNISLFMLSVPKSEMASYMEFWKEFWARVDDYTKKYPGGLSPGPHKLPSRDLPSRNRLEPLASLANGVQSLAKSLGNTLSVQEAKAQYISRADYPRCTVRLPSSPNPLPKCNDDDDYFYFANANYSNFSEKSLFNFQEKIVNGIGTFGLLLYESTHKCGEMDPVTKKRPLEGEVKLVKRWEHQICIGNGDASGLMSRTYTWDHQRGVGEYKASRYCLDSKDVNFKRYNDAYIKSGRLELGFQPKWCDE